MAMANERGNTQQSAPESAHTTQRNVLPLAAASRANMRGRSTICPLGKGALGAIGVSEYWNVNRAILAGYRNRISCRSGALAINGCFTPLTRASAITC